MTHGSVDVMPDTRHGMQMLQDKATIPSLALRAAALWGDQPAIIDLHVTVTFAELFATARRVARGLLAQGVTKGDRIAIWAPNRWEWVATAIGIQCLGAVLVPLNTRLKGREVADILIRTRTRMLFSAGTFLNTYYPDMLKGHTLPDLHHIVVMDEPVAVDPLQESWSAFLAAGASVQDVDIDAHIQQVRPEDLCDLMFTSGTTGKPKGAMFNHAQTVSAGIITTQISLLDDASRFVTFGPFSHNAGYKAGWVSGLASGAAVVINNDLTAEGIIRLIEQHRITFMPSPPTIWHKVLEEPLRHQADLSSLRVISTGGTSVPVTLIHRLQQEFPNVTVMTGYGLTECCGSASQTRSSDAAEIIARTAGHQIVGTTIKIIDPDGRTLGPNEVGEVTIRNASITLGYLDDPAATRAAIDEEGWLHTGDIGSIDEQGNLRITDRLKDMYIVGGFNCYPAEVEHILRDMPGIGQVAVVGMDDEVMGQVGRAYIVPQPGVRLTEADVITWSRANMATYKVPRTVRFLEQLPFNASGKVVKHELAALPQLG